MGWLDRGRQPSQKRIGFALYAAANRAARDPYCYTVLGVPDTIDGRFDLLGLMAALLIRRLRLDAPPGPALAQAVFDAMFADMDASLREMGVGDLSVGKKMRALWEAFHGRARAYEAALAANDQAMLATAIERNLWRGTAPEGKAAAVAAWAAVQVAHLAALPLSAFADGSARFLPTAPPVPPPARSVVAG